MVLHRRVWLVGSLSAVGVAVVVTASLLFATNVSRRGELLRSHAQATTFLTRSELYTSEAQLQAAAAYSGRTSAGRAAALLNAYASQTRASRMLSRYAAVMSKLGPLPAGASTLGKSLRAVLRVEAQDSGANMLAQSTDAAAIRKAAQVGVVVEQLFVDFARVRTADDEWWAGRFTDLARQGSWQIRWLITIAGLVTLSVVASHLLLGRVARRRDLELAERDNDLASVARANEFEARLQRALELSQTEERVFGVVEQALRETVPELGVEMLLADSSRAHFQQMLATGGERQASCSVESPGRCPAAQRGEVLTFESNTSLDACPYLKDAARPCSAVCVPVSVSGTTVGVVHAAGPDHEPPSVEGRTALELVARRASDRIGLMRAFSRSEVEASTDALTGLPNRRAIENSARRLAAERRTYAVAFADLDHFKTVNDKHGHGAGDQALRVFARVLRDSLRPDDQCARYGGEEFVVVLPDCDEREAVRILERVRERLALTLASADCPAFTASFGLVVAAAGQSFGDVVSLADAALLEAKRQGRNRVVIAEDTVGASAN